MENFTTKLTDSSETVTWGRDTALITHLSYDPANRTILVVHNDILLKCRIAGYERDTAAALWKSLAKAHKEKDRVYFCARGNWSPTEWFCGMHNHTEDFYDAERCAMEVDIWKEIIVSRSTVEVNRLLP